jgi:hypothetical protein
MIWSPEISRTSQILVLVLTLNWPSRRGSNSIILNNSKSRCLFVCLLSLFCLLQHLIFRNRKTETKPVSIVQSHTIFAQIITCKQTRLCNSLRTINETSMQIMVSCIYTTSFTTEGRAPGSRWIYEAGTGPQQVWTPCCRGKMSCSCREPNPDSSAV